MNIKNRVRNLESSSLSDNLSQHSVLQTLDLFEGNPSVKSLINDYIQQQLAEAKKQGAREAVSRISSEIGKHIDGYVILVTKLVDTISDTANKEFSGQDFKIIDVRTNFDFGTRAIKIIFIIDSSFDYEFSFSGLVNEAEQFVLEKENFLSEILYINERGAEKIDQNAINEDFPFARKKK